MAKRNGGLAAHAAFRHCAFSVSVLPLIYRLLCQEESSLSPADISKVKPGHSGFGVTAHLSFRVSRSEWPSSPAGRGEWAQAPKDFHFGSGSYFSADNLVLAGINPMISWIFQRISGLVLLVMLSVHIGTARLQSLNHEHLMLQLRSPAWVFFYSIFALASVSHGLNGMWQVALDYVKGRQARMITGVVIWTAGIFGTLLTAAILL